MVLGSYFGSFFSFLQIFSKVLIDIAYSVIKSRLLLSLYHFYLFFLDFLSFSQLFTGILSLLFLGFSHYECHIPIGEIDYLLWYCLYFAGPLYEVLHPVIEDHFSRIFSADGAAPGPEFDSRHEGEKGAQVEALPVPAEGSPDGDCDQVTGIRVV